MNKEDIILTKDEKKIIELLLQIDKLWGKNPLLRIYWRSNIGGYLYKTHQWLTSTNRVAEFKNIRHTTYAYCHDPKYDKKTD